MTVPADMKVSIEGGQPERVTKDFAEFNAGFDVARDGKTLVLGTYDFKAQRPTIPRFLLIPARSCECSSTTRGIRGNPASAPTAKVSSTLSVKREWTICGCNRWTAAPADS